MNHQQVAARRMGGARRGKHLTVAGPREWGQRELTKFALEVVESAGGQRVDEERRDSSRRENRKSERLQKRRQNSRSEIFARDLRQWCSLNNLSFCHSEPASLAGEESALAGESGFLAR
jgi:hypothetical protein